MVLGLLTSLLLLHYGQTALWALEMQGDCWASAGWGGERICINIFFHQLLKA